ncbi:hypothetical protein [Sinomonas sp. P47F7]|uniref:hypothetical protein n=1 Tax=Sinomonas sp. P47F7 TaxID=3410987 RepID=UPI003BF57847
MSRTDSKIRSLVDEAFQNFEGQSVAGLVRQALRIATGRKDFVGQLGFQQQLIDLATKEKASISSLDPIDRALRALVGNEEALKIRHEQLEAYLTSRKLVSRGDMRYCVPIGRIESEYIHLKLDYDTTVIPDNVPSADVVHAYRMMDQERAQLIPLLGDSRAILERVRQLVYDYLLKTEADLDEGRGLGGVFDRGVDYARGRLSQLDPQALAMFDAAHVRFLSADPEALSHALTSIRRMFKSIADVVYPPTGEEIVGDDGVPRTMDDAAYRNRLIQFVRNRLGKHDQGDVVKEQLRSFGTRLKTLDELASKGVHSSVGVAEAESCLQWSFMLVIEILRIADAQDVVSGSLPTR